MLSHGQRVSQTHRGIDKKRGVLRIALGQSIQVSERSLELDRGRQGFAGWRERDGFENAGVMNLPLNATGQAVRGDVGGDGSAGQVLECFHVVGLRILIKNESVCRCQRRLREDFERHRTSKSQNNGEKAGELGSVHVRRKRLGFAR